MSESTKNLPDDNLGNNPFISGRAYEGQVDTDGVIRLRLDSSPRGVLLLESAFPVGVSLAGYRNGIATFRVTRQWEFLVRRDIAADLVADFNFDTTVNGDTDHEYRLDGYWKTSQGSTNIARWRLNDAASGLTSEGSRYHYVSGTDATTTGLVVARTVSTAGEHYFTAFLQAKSGSNRLGYSTDVVTWGTTTTTQDLGKIGCKREDTGVVVRSVGLAFDNNDCDAGSHFTLYRRPQLNKTKIKIWVY